MLASISFKLVFHRLAPRIFLAVRLVPLFAFRLAPAFYFLSLGRVVPKSPQLPYFREQHFRPNRADASISSLLRSFSLFKIVDARPPFLRSATPLLLVLHPRFSGIIRDAALASVAQTAISTLKSLLISISSYLHYLVQHRALMR